MVRIGCLGLFAPPLHSDIIVPYIYADGTDEQKHKYLPGCDSEETIQAVAQARRF